MDPPDVAKEAGLSKPEVTPTETRSRPEDCLTGGGEMGALMRSTDWSRTVFGPVASWPQSLRTAVSIMLEARFAIVVAWGPDFRFLYNDRYRPILGLTKHPEALGRGAAEIFPEVWHAIGPEFERVRRGDSFALDDWLLPLDRNGYLENCWFTVSYSPIRDETGGVGGLLAVVAETTGRVEGERRLATLRDLARRAGEAKTPEAACTDAAAVLGQNAIDVPFGLVYLLEMEGTRARRAAVVGLPSDHAAAPETIELTRESDGGWPLARVVHESRVEVIEDLRTRFGPLPGGPYPEMTHSAVLLPLVRPGQVRPYGVLVAGVSPRRALDDRYRDFFDLAADHIATAVSNALAFEEERRRAEALAEIDRAKTAFFSNVSHEFRTPLTLLLGPTEDALRSPERALRGESLETVHRNALRLLKLVNALLDFSRIEAGRVQATYRPADLARATLEAASGFRSTFERAGLTFEVTVGPLSEPAWIDREMWEKVVLNLLSNAFKFTFEGGVTVRLAEGPRHFQLAVADTGTGIPADELDNVFKRFHRVDSARSRSHEGSGIGLALTQELVRLHGGEIGVTSAPGRGTTFTVSLPRGSAHLPADRIGAADEGEARPSPARPYVEEALRWTGDDDLPPTAGGENGRVLVADDNADMRSYLQRVLGTRWDVEAVADGTAALEAARARPPDVVLSDVMMPGLDGFALLRALKSDERTRDVPVVLLSARAGEEARAEGLERGADDYLVKPFSARELLARIGSQVALVRARREAEAASRAKDDFLAMLSHELRNPLAPILTALELMRRREGAQVVERERNVIERQARGLTRLVDDLLDVSRITRGKVDLERRPVEMAAVVARAVEMASPLLEEKRHHLTVTTVEGCPVLADEHRLAQAVANLLTNAARYTDPGGHVEIRSFRDGADVVLAVQDDGIGMSAELLPRVFEVFVQGARTLDRAQGGLGLGLAIARSLVALHGGSLFAESAGTGRGSTFTLRLPHIEASAAAPDPATTAPAIPASPAYTARVLVVDDNQDAADVLADALNAAGYEARTAYDAPAALEMARSFRPTVAMLDLGLPVMDGYELARHLRALAETAGVRLVAITGYGQPADRELSRQAGFDEHLVKPLDFTTIVSILGPMADAARTEPDAHRG
jgi:signal transduction histidine kinase